MRRETLRREQTNGSGTKGDELLNRNQTAALLGLKPQTLASWLTNHRYPLPVIKIGRNCVRYRRSDIERFLDECTVKSD